MVETGTHTAETAIGNGVAHKSTGSAGTSKHIAHTTSSNPKEKIRSSTFKGAPVAASSSISSRVSSVGKTPSPTNSISEVPAVSARPPSVTETSISAAGAATHTSSLSEGSKKAIIAASTIGGTLILALLLYVIWRRRRGARYSELVCFRRHSDTITVTPTLDERMTALPIYQETRYSVRSSRLGSTLSLGLSKKRPSGVPDAVAKRFHKENPWIQTAWKTANPPTPTNESHPLTQVVTAPPSPVLKQPEMVRVYSSQTAKSRMTKNTSGDTKKSGLAVAIEEASPTHTDFGPPPETPRSPDERPDRWSWTNSQAPPTPRLAAGSRRSSLSSLPKFKRVTSWVRGQAERQGIRIAEEPPPAIRRTSMPVLKNKASKPNLAPKPPTRKLSKKKRPESRSSAVRPSLDNSVIAVPAPAKAADQRLQTAPHEAEDDGLTISYS